MARIGSVARSGRIAKSYVRVCPQGKASGEFRPRGWQNPLFGGRQNPLPGYTGFCHIHTKNAWFGTIGKPDEKYERMEEKLDGMAAYQPYIYIADPRPLFL